jgi:hypothetical protein
MKMDKTKAESNSAPNELAEIKSLLQSLLIIEGARAGLSRDQVRSLTGVQTKRVSEIWSDIKTKKDK